MAEITEAQARRICWALGVNPDVTLACYGEPNWRIVQRAAAEGGKNDVG